MSLKQNLKEVAAKQRADELTRITNEWLETPEGRSFHQTPYNWTVLNESLSYDLPVTVAKMSKHFWKLRSHGYEFTKAEAAAREKKAVEQSAAAQEAAAAAERLRIYNSPEQRAAREQARVEREAREEKELLASFWKPAFPAEDSHSILIRATAATENYHRRKLGFPERS